MNTHHHIAPPIDTAAKDPAAGYKNGNTMRHRLATMETLQYSPTLTRSSCN